LQSKSISAWFGVQFACGSLCNNADSAINLYTRGSCAPPRATVMSHENALLGEHIGEMSTKQLRM